MKIWAIAKAGFKECLRYRLVYFVFIMAVLFILAGKGCKLGKIQGEGFLFDVETRQNMALSSAYYGIVLWSIMLCGIVSASVLSRELEEGTVALTLSRPLRRSSFIAGKLLSVLMISGFNLFLLGGIFFSLFYFEVGSLNFSIFSGFTLMLLNIIMYALMCMLLSLWLPRLVTPLVGILIYFTSCWSALPFYFEKLRFLWIPSETLTNMHSFMPRFGDIQFIGESLINSSLTFNEIAIPVCSCLLYCTALWFLLVLVFNKKQI